MNTEEPLLAEARARLAELDEADEDDLGDRVELEPGDGFAGHWRGEGVMRTKEGEEIPVYLLREREGRLRFHYRNAALVREIEELRPEVGDEIAIVRGEDREFEVQGEGRRMMRFAVRVRPASAAE